MSYELLYEGIAPDEELHEQILMECRRLVVATEDGDRIQFLIRQIDGRIQCRVEVALPQRHLSVMVWRLDPVNAVDAAVEAALSALVAENHRSYITPDVHLHLSMAPTATH